MNEIIVTDANIIVSSLMRGSRQIRRTLARKDLQFVSPKFIVVELFKHAPKIQKATKLSKDKVLELLSSLVNQIKFYLRIHSTNGSTHSLSGLNKNPCPLPVFIRLGFNCGVVYFQKSLDL